MIPLQEEFLPTNIEYPSGLLTTERYWLSSRQMGISDSSETSFSPSLALSTKHMDENSRFLPVLFMKLTSSLTSENASICLRLMVMPISPDRAIKEAMKCEMYFTQDEKLRRKYEIQEKARRDYISMMHNIEKSRTEGWQKGLEEGRAEGLAEGREEGRAEGRKEGRAEGRKEGREEGRLEERKRFTEQTVATMLQEGLSHELIARIMGLPEETVQAIAAAQSAPAAE